MNTVLAFSILAFGGIGLVLKNYWESKLSNIIQKQVEIKTSINAKDVLNELFGNSVKINKVEKTKGIGADYYSPVTDEFFLTEDTERNNSASITIAYFLGLIKIASPKANSSLAFANILRLILNPALIIFIAISIFSSNSIYLSIVIILYVTLVLLEILQNKTYFHLTKSFITKTFKKGQLSISNTDFILLNEYANIRWLQLVTMMVFHPLLVTYYYLYYFIKK